jgi:hypothetical protein
MTAPLLVLPARRMVLDRETLQDGRWVSRWFMSDDPTERLGGERSVWYWLRAEKHLATEAATRLTRLWWGLRDGVPALAQQYDDLLDVVPADRHHDVRPQSWLFAALANATWCPRCVTAPSWSMQPGSLCAWCGAADIAA